MRFRLRYLHHDLELSEGQFAVGRSADCQLSLDDPLVSRRHALLVVARESVTVEDTGSRNGVLVNGLRITERASLRPGDRILIGSQELTLLLGREGLESEPTNAEPTKNTIPSLAAARPVDEPPPASTRPHELLRPPPDLTVHPPPPRPAREATEPNFERRTDAFDLLGRVADKALALGRAEEAERLLAAPLAEVLEGGRAGRRLTPELVELAGRFAAKLATATGRGAWVDYAIELYDLQGRPCPASVVDELYGALHKVNGIDLVRLRAYVGRLRDRQSGLGPADRFLLQRIEGLERLAALR